MRKLVLTLLLASVQPIQLQKDDKKKDELDMKRGDWKNLKKDEGFEMYKN